MTETTTDQEFPLHEARALVRQFMMPNPWIYWTDFLFYIVLAWTAWVTALRVPPFSLVQIATYVIAALAFYRTAIFIHELAHLKKGTFRMFRVVWNLVCGIPLLVPSFTYDGVHNDHHKRDVYGTDEDGEYIPFARNNPAGMISYVLLSFILPLLLIVRFLILAPLSWLLPPFRRSVWALASSLTIDIHYQRPENAIRNDRHWRMQEFATFVFAATVVVCIALGVLSYQVAVLWYAITAMIFFLNSLRTLAAHAYRNPPGRKLSVGGQYLDSINIPGNLFLTALWAPVGLRYHATHHLFPNLPYHNLGKAHRHLVRHLTDNSLYLQTLRSSLWDALRRIWHEAATVARD